MKKNLSLAQSFVFGQKSEQWLIAHPINQLKIGLLFLSFLFLSSPAFACVETTIAKPNPTAHAVKEKKKDRLKKLFSLVESTEKPIPKSQLYLALFVASTVATIILSRQAEKAEAAAVSANSYFSGLAGLEYALWGALTFVLAIVFLVLFLVRRKKEKSMIS